MRTKRKPTQHQQPTRKATKQPERENGESSEYAARDDPTLHPSYADGNVIGNRQGTATIGAQVSRFGLGLPDRVLDTLSTVQRTQTLARVTRGSQILPVGLVLASLPTRNLMGFRCSQLSWDNDSDSTGAFEVCCEPII